jgi:cardiolipin synthase
MMLYIVMDGVEFGRFSPRMVSWFVRQQEAIWNMYDDNYKIFAFCGCRSVRWLSKKELEVTPHVLLLIPNLISLFRLLSILPIFLIGWMLDAPRLFYPVVYLFLMTLDLIDGPIARQCGLGSLLGKALDPLADKIAHLSILSVAVLFGLAPLWLFAVLLVKEAILFLFSPHYKKSGAKWWGKVGTLTEAMVFLSAFLFTIPTWVFVALAVSQIAILFAYIISDKDT